MIGIREASVRDCIKLPVLLGCGHSIRFAASWGGEIKGEWEGRLTRFVSRLEAKVEDRRYGCMFAPPVAALKYDWLSKQVAKLLAPGDGKHGINVVDFSEVPSDVLPVVTGVFARLYDVQFWMEPEKAEGFDRR